MRLVGSILYDADAMVAEMVAARIPSVADVGFGDFTALGVVRNGAIVGGVVFNNYRGHDIHAHLAFDTPRWALPQTMRDLFAYPFGQLPCRRITSPVGRKNKAARKLIEGLGFKLEGVVRRGLDGKEDIVLYGMLREECRWIVRKH